MSLQTTVVGSMPKPDNLSTALPTWVSNGRYHEDFITRYNEALIKFSKDEYDSVIKAATKKVVDLQTEAGIDIITDGEIRRDSYIFGFCRQLNGIDFVTLENKIIRNGAIKITTPRIIGKLSRNKNKCSMTEEWLETTKCSTRHVKITLPGPMTIIDTIFDSYYGENCEKELYEDLVKCIQEEIKELCNAGCKNIQIDEPVLIRNPDKALSIGLEMLNQCFSVANSDVNTIVHVCCGLPEHLDQKEFQKSNQSAYIDIVTGLDEGLFKQISIEDAHRRNPNKLFQSLKKKTIILGVIDVVKSRIETVEEIKEHISDVMKYIPKERLVIAPDCGLIYLPQDIMMAKLKNMVTAAKEI